MKRIGYLYNKLLNVDYIKNIIIKASKGKTKRSEVRKVLDNIDYYAFEIYKMIESQNYELKPTYNRTITDGGKQRVLTISPFFPNRILDNLIVDILKPIIMKGMYRYCVGNVNNRGITDGVKCVKRKIRKAKYFIKLDIHHFYPSVKSQLLCGYLRRYVKDEKFLKLCDVLILENDDLPIGSYYSQWFSNFYLQDLDHYIKEALQIPYYVRYVDDMLLMSNNKRQLLYAQYKINEFLKCKCLELKRVEQVRLTENSIDFLGYKFYKDKTHLRIKIFKVLNKRIKTYNKHCSVSTARALLSYSGWCKYTTNGYMYLRKRISKGYLRNIVSTYDKNSKPKSEVI